jgi:hypothetical protein
MNSSHSFYDELRATDPGNFFPIIGGNEDHTGRNLHRYNGASDEDSSIVMCHVPQFMRYTSMRGVVHQDRSETAYGASVGAIMAMNHWNNGNGAIVKDIEGINQRCKIRFTTEIFNTQVRNVVRMCSYPAFRFNNLTVLLCLLCFSKRL